MELIRQFAALGVVFGLLALALWLLRGQNRLRWKRPGKARADAPALESLDRLVLSPQHVLHLVRAGDRVLILATYAGGCTLLAPLPPAPETTVVRRTAALERVAS